MEYPDTGNAGPNLGLVINADCDLVNDKTDGVIAYLPVYTFREYLDGFWAGLHLAEVADLATRKILDIVEADESEASDLRVWLHSAPAATVLEKFATLTHIKRTQHAQLADQLTRLQICTAREMTPLDRFSALCQLDKEPATAARKQIVAAKKAMGDGHFFISDLIDHGEIGFVIRMRRIYTIAEDRCFTSIASQRALSDGDSVTAVRFARLTPLYQFKVAQLFAQQYSRIGLPDDITALSDVAIEVLASSLSQVKL